MEIEQKPTTEAMAPAAMATAAPMIGAEQLKKFTQVLEEY